jgi:pimeloyl-ACP methyl ester carboxylesterase
VELGFAPSENPLVVEHGGFYRRWFSMIDDLDELREAVAALDGTTEDLWVPVWQAHGRAHEAAGGRLEAAGDHDAARREYLQAKTYYAIGRYPGGDTPSKAEVNADCIRAFRTASARLDPPLEFVEVPHESETITSHFRAPAGASADAPVPAVLVMCGADVFKEDRAWAADHALDNGLASLVMDAPGTGENPFPWAPESVAAWESALDYLASRPEVDGNRLGAFGISRGGYSVMQLAGHAPDKVKAVVANGGHPFGYEMNDAEMEEYVAHRNRRAEWVFGPPGSSPSFPSTSADREREAFQRWALSSQGILEDITMPVLMINGKLDHLNPIGNIYFMFEHGPVGRKEARIYADAGHCAFKYQDHWAPASFAWLAEKLGG